MRQIIDFFNRLFEVIESLITFVINFIDNTLKFITMLPEVITQVTSSISWLPPALMVFATASVTVSVIFIMLGRGKSN